MHSSTSSSSDRRATKAIVGLLALIAVYFVALELAMSLVIPRLSSSAKREVADYAMARATRAANASPQVLLIGNSLLLHGVDRALLTQELGPSFQAAFLPVENTSYLDWYYGLRRLFAEGARPAAVVMSINIRQLMSEGTNGEPFARRMMLRSDLLAVRADSRLDNTTASAYFFATFSEWLGSRSGFHNWLLEQWLPNAGDLVSRFTGGRPLPDIPVDAVRDRAVARLIEISDLCEANGARFMFVVPATTNVNERAAVLRSAAAEKGVRVIVPIEPGEMPRNMFGDGFHLNESGARQFTRKLAPLLKEALAVTRDQGFRRPALGEKAGG